MRHRLFCFVLVFLLPACAVDYELLSGAIKEKGGAVYDKVLDENIWFMCEAASVRSVRERFGRSIEMADAYHTICDTRSDRIIQPSE